MITVPILNIRGSRFPHADAEIVGNYEGLQKLKKALEAALKPPGAVDDCVFDSEGEEYHISVERYDDCSGLAAPYVGD